MDGDVGAGSQRTKALAKPRRGSARPFEAWVGVVDDERTERLALLALFSKLGVACVEYASAEDLFKDLKSGRRLDAVFVDDVMPGINGWHACRVLAAGQFSASSIPCAMAASKTQATDRIWAQKCGASAWIPKPWSDADLKRAIHAIPALAAKVEAVQLSRAAGPAIAAEPQPPRL